MANKYDLKKSDITIGEVYIWEVDCFLSGFDGRVVDILSEKDGFLVSPVKINIEDWKLWQTLWGRGPKLFYYTNLICKSKFF